MSTPFRSKQPGFRRLKALRQSLRTSCQAIGKFMVHRAQSSPNRETYKSPHDAYTHRAKFYPYLPVEEEQRDWLERLYHRS